jgi:hypothetical protein
VSSIKTNQLMVHGEIIAVCSNDNHRKHTNTNCGQNANCQMLQTVKNALKSRTTRTAFDTSQLSLVLSGPHMYRLMVAEMTITTDNPFAGTCHSTNKNKYGTCKRCHHSQLTVSYTCNVNHPIYFHVENCFIYLFIFALIGDTIVKTTHNGKR